MKAIKNFHFDNVATDIRRNLTSINAMVNNDTKHLSKLLTAERGVWNALSTLTYEQSEAAKYLNIWGKSEDVDLSDITEKFSLLITKLSETEGVLADRYSQYRGHLKDIRGREEAMKDQRLKKETLWNKIEKEERKASHSKHSETAEQKLKDLHKELEKIEKETIAEETALQDFKRQKLRTALLLQLDALLEFGEKVIIIANYSMDIVEQIPIETTSPGEPRKTYTGQGKTSQAISDASTSLSTWTPKSRSKNLVPVNVPIATSDIDLPSSAPPTGFIVPTPPKGTPNSENVDFTFSSSNRKHVGGSSLAVSDDSNEADHSDLDHSEVEVESNKDKNDRTTEIKTKFEEVITTSTIDNEENESFAASSSTVPRPPTPPKVRTDSSDDLKQETTPSVTTSEIQTSEQTINVINENVKTLLQEKNENSSKHVHFSA
ncbi:Eisosome component PIL1-domain-containing protein [Glomus cerebriforme]|uniref:Eisosome component PIL1-domain-containing protein n=1 Tax=Glomus cerebriforme TaxID=658196 RepID=A0A397SE98_9GLOM|nr:Eisosome component PIL1-domain-containing protein [Glomus cerebriforme]